MTIGSVIPKITLKNEKGEDIDVSTLVKGTGVVIFAAPKADTREYHPSSSIPGYSHIPAGCNKQACHFRDSTEEFKKLGYAVYALTADAPAALTKWQAKNNLGYSLISDPKREFIHALGAKSGNSTKRSHFVFEKDTGKLLEATIGVKPDDRYANAGVVRSPTDGRLATPKLSNLSRFFEKCQTLNIKRRFQLPQSSTSFIY